jgi:hypothetical protein
VPLCDSLVQRSPTCHPMLAPAAVAQVGRPCRRTRSCDRSIRWSALLVALCAIAAAPAVAETSSKEQMQGLDEQVQEIKSDVLAIAAELGRLEEKLLYPSNTQVAVFVSLAEGEELRLDSVQLRIDGELVAHHIYSFKELEALRKGGVQRIYTGNVASGEHRLEVAIAGKRADGADFTGDAGYGFHKGVEPEMLGIALGGAAADASGIRVEAW